MEIIEFSYPPKRDEKSDFDLLKLKIQEGLVYKTQSIKFRENGHVDLSCLIERSKSRHGNH